MHNVFSSWQRTKDRVNIIFRDVIERFNWIETDFKFHVRKFRLNAMDNGEPINIFLNLRVVIGFCFSVKSLMRKCRNWIKGAKRVEQRELLGGNWKSSGEA